ncbi:MAG: hypothetical protein OEM52_13920 [bacterium]|nr:hypothetical protein [bacterium]
MSRLFPRILLLLLGAALSVAFVTGCGENSTEPVLTQRNATANDDAVIAQHAATAFSGFMLAIEQHKPLLGVNGGVNYGVFRPVEWDSTYTATAFPGLQIQWSDTFYSRLIQGTDLQILRFDHNISTNAAYKPARIEQGIYRYGMLNLALRQYLPDSLRNNYPIAYDVKEFDMTYAANGTDSRTLVGTGMITGTVAVQIQFSNDNATGTLSQSDTVMAAVTFRNVGSAIGDNSVEFELNAAYPYYNPLTDRVSFSRKHLTLTISVNSLGRGTGSVVFGGEERVRLYFNGRPYFYAGSYRIAADGFSTERPIEFE